ncbi:unnamed protein product [Lactuca saligna]|uniref:Uncharacterized protein n=1 Tax=Lactuca saligna TaxID=75948 RepID=A0AA35YXU1_LACSI|nr:unnamed protein product [Lactuca saligna]
MHESITTIFSSQSTEAERMIHDEEPNDDEIMVSFADLQFDPEEYNVPDNLITSAQENGFRIMFDGIKQKKAEKLEVHSKSFKYENQKLRDITKEHLELFVEQVTKMKESMDLKVVELKFEV